MFSSNTKSGRQRRTNSFLARAARLLLFLSVYFYLPLLEIHLIVFHSICFPFNCVLLLLLLLSFIITIIIIIIIIIILLY